MGLLTTSALGRSGRWRATEVRRRALDTCTGTLDPRRASPGPPGDARDLREPSEDLDANRPDRRRLSPSLAPGDLSVIASPLVRTVAYVWDRTDIRKIENAAIQ